jgi:hypothetical protein
MNKREIKIWYGKLEDAERFPDLKYWQSQPTEKIFDTAWEIVLEAHALKGDCEFSEKGTLGRKLYESIFPFNSGNYLIRMQ